MLVAERNLFKTTTCLLRLTVRVCSHGVLPVNKAKEEKATNDTKDRTVDDGHVHLSNSSVVRINVTYLFKKSNNFIKDIFYQDRLVILHLAVTYGLGSPSSTATYRRKTYYHPS